VVRDDAPRDFYLSTGWKVACGGLQEEEGLFGYRIVEFFDVVCVITPYGDDLFE
jgi:hypothetical protein